MTPVPVIDVGPLVDPRADPTDVALAARAIDRACREVGFLVIEGHGTDPALAADLEAQARAFFALPEADKAAISMDRGGRAWRGWFPLGGELTSGVPDRKEGIYFGREAGPDDPGVAAGLPLHGPNLFPAEPAGLRPAVLAWMEAMTRLGQAVVGGLALGLGLDRDWFERTLTTDPVTLFRIFRYPPPEAPSPVATGGWGVAEHTDYGLLTLLLQDATGGLEVHGPDGWVDVPPLPGTIVCNLGDMLERMTGGRYRSTPHRVRRTEPGHDRLSFPFFFDPSWDAEVQPIPGCEQPVTGSAGRWDGTDLHALTGTYGDHLTTKVAKVFPALGTEVL